MGQNTILASGTTGATSTDVVIAAGASVNIGIFPATAPFTVSGNLAVILMDTPGGDIGVYNLTDRDPVRTVNGPGTFRVARAPLSQSCGVFSET